MASRIERGDIVLVVLHGATGTETRKTRPAVVVSNDINNRVAPILTVIPLSSSVQRVYPFDVLLKTGHGVKKDSRAMANQIRTIDRQRVRRKLGKVGPETMSRIEDAILLHLGIER